MDFFILLPNSIENSKASFSLSLDLETIAFKICNWANFCRMASRATSDQFISGHRSIFNFISSGMAKVNAGIGSSSGDVNNTHNTQEIYKPFAG